MYLRRGERRVCLPRRGMRLWSGLGGKYAGYGPKGCGKAGKKQWHGRGKKNHEQEKTGGWGD